MLTLGFNLGGGREKTANLLRVKGINEFSIRSTVAYAEQSQRVQPIRQLPIQSDSEGKRMRLGAKIGGGREDVRGEGGLSGGGEGANMRSVSWKQVEVAR